MTLDWREEYVDQRVADTERGRYRVDDADSLGQRRVTFMMDGQECFVGAVYCTDDGINRAQAHHDWLNRIRDSKEHN